MFCQASNQCGSIVESQQDIGRRRPGTKTGGSPGGLHERRLGQPLGLVLGHTLVLAPEWTIVA